MFTKKGQVEEIGVSFVSLVILAIVLIIAGSYFFVCDAVHFCGAHAKDVTVGTGSFVSTARLVNLLRTPVIDKENLVHSQAFADLIIKTYKTLPVEAQPGDPAIRGYINEATRLVELPRPSRLDGKTRSAWNIRVIKLPEEKEISALAVVPKLDALSVDEVLMQRVVLPLGSGQGLLRVELYLRCIGCTKEAVLPYQ